MQNYYLICTLTDDPAQPDKGWAADLLTEHSFPCKHIDFGYRPEPVLVRELGEDVALNFVDRVLIKYIRRDLLELLSPEIRQCLQLGTLIHTVNGRSESHCALWSQQRVILRGGEQSYAHVCETCRQLIYNPRGDDWYVLQSNVSSAPIMLTDHNTLVITETLYKRLAGRAWQKLDISPLEVRDEPLDGFPADLRTLTKEQERRWEPRRNRR